MAITIRNKETEELIRRIGLRTGEEPDAVLLRLVKAEAGPAEVPPAVAPEEVARRMKAFAELREKYPPPEPNMTWKEVERDMDALFDYLEEEGAPFDGSDK